MNIYQDLEDSIYNVLETLFPDWTVVFAYSNYQESSSPYVAIDVMRLDDVGMGYTNSLVLVDPDNDETGTQYTYQDMCAKVKFDIIGRYDDNTTVANMAQELVLYFKTERGQAALRKNRLARQGSFDVKRRQLIRDTDIWMNYQVVCELYYTAIDTDEPGYITSMDLGGEYTDAGREPDHKIPTYVQINYPSSP